LAETGNDGSSTLLLSLGGATLLLAGGAVVAYVRMRRSA
jgi:LPXTG-motif cell wall-anchored protein